MASLRDVAQLAGVSVSTVSRVIRNSIPVDHHTRERVEEAIRKTNYRPNLLAQGLRGKSHNFIGLVVPEIAHHTFAGFINCVERHTVAAGFELLLRNTKGDPEREEQFIDKLIRLHVTGVIFARVSDRSRVLRMLDETDIPFVVVDRALKQEGMPSVVLNNYEAGRLAARHLHDLGHREVGCITGPKDIFLTRERIRGFREYFEEQGGEVNQESIFEGDFKFASGAAAASTLLARGRRVTALWCENDLMAVGAMKTLTKAGIRVPEEISILGMDNLDLCEMVTPALSSIVQPFDDMAEKSVDLIVQAVENGNQWEHATFEPSIVERDSTIPIADSSNHGGQH